MSIIEQAARRLEQLRRAGVEIPSGSRSGPAARPKAVIDLGAAGGADVPLAVAAAAAAAAAQAAQAAQLAQVAAPARPAKQSRRVEIDVAALAAAGFVTPDAPRSRLADEFRVVKRPLLDNVRGRSAAPVQRANCIMVTSSVPGEGKTFTAINLALSIAQELDTHVMLVDADVIRPSILERIGLPVSKGLMDVLTDPDTDFSDVILRTNIENLSLLPAGTAHDRATELLASEGMRKMVQELGSRYPDRVLIFDTPPLLASTESRVLATHVGQIVVVVESERTRQSTLAEALATVESCPVVMMMLNKSRQPVAPGYSTYYGY